MHKPLNTMLCLCLLLFAIGIISLMLLIQQQLEQKFERDLNNVDLVVGAKGSPLQLVLSAIYHLDAPTGNIKLSDARTIMNNPMVESAIPLAYGDSYRGHRILGTTTDYITKYNGQLGQGQLFEHAMEAVIGAAVAEKAGLQVGDIFTGTHGEVQSGHVHDEHPYTVVGVLNPTQTVLDQLVLTNIESVWQVHHHEAPNHPTIDTLHATALDFEHDHEHHEHEHSAAVITADSMEITALLLEYKSKMAMLNMPRIINEQTNMQAVLPALEINRLFYMLGVGTTTIKMIAAGIMLMAGFSVFFVLFNRLRERKYELGLMRSVGYRPWQLFSLLLLEGVLLSFIGYLLGWFMSRVGIYIVNQQAESSFNLQFSSAWVIDEVWLLLMTLFVGIVAALIPAWRAMHIDISETLTEH